MSLALADQKLGSHSSADSTSYKFMLKGRQSGGMHRGHAWVFRAESYDTMLAWFDDIRNLTEKTGAERSAFIQRSHARSVSAGSHKAGSISSDGMEEDEADQVPYSAITSQAEIEREQEKLPERPHTGGRFPSTLAVNDRDSHVPLSLSSNGSSGDREIVASAGALPGSSVPFGASGQQVLASDDETKATKGEMAQASAVPLHDYAYSTIAHQQDYNGLPVLPGANPGNANGAENSNSPIQAQGISSEGPSVLAYRKQPHVERHDSKYGDWMGSTAAGIRSRAGTEAYRHQHDHKKAATTEEQAGLQVVEPRASAAASDAPQKLAEQPVQGAIFVAIPSSTSATDDTALTANRDVSTITGSLHLNDPAEPVRNLADLPDKPSLEKRADTISDLHLPGEFPRGQSVADSL